MGLKIHDFFVRCQIRCLVIVEIICLIFFCRRLYRKDCGGSQRKIFRLKPSSLRQEYGTLYIQASSYSERGGKEILQQFDTDVEALPCSRLAAVEQCLALH